MCEINAIVKMGDNYLSEKDREEFLKMLEAGGKKNSDAWGYFTKSCKEKHSGNHISQNLKINFGKDWFVIGHNRLSTGGNPKDNKNNHPFWNEKYVMVHNGSITNADDLIKKYYLDIQDIKTDSFIVLKLIEMFGSKNNIKKTLDRVLPLLKGSYSILLYDIEDDEIYYFKDLKTSFTMELVGDNTIVASTNKRRVKNFGNVKKWNFFDVLKVPHYYGDLKSYHLYNIKNDGITDLGEITHRQKKDNYYNKYYPGSYKYKYQKRKQDQKYSDPNVEKYKVIKEEFDLNDGEIVKLIENLGSTYECPFYNKCSLDLLKCPLYKKSLDIDIPYFCPHEWASFSVRDGEKVI